MRLIDTKTLNLQEFIDGTIPKYAILSHTWEPGQEVTLHEMAALDAAGRKNGFSKIRETCRLARRDNIGYAWVDTCCINKDSSAELSEAINSMYDWYAEAAICYAYLSDLEPSETQEGDSPKGLSECRWFTRGWTLQELLAPNNVQFYDRDWALRGTKRSLRGIISQITNIDIGILTKSVPLESILVGKRMSWASSRVTTRVEDMAYCLLGIFDVNMPLLYGERMKAFARLQEEIIRSSNDLSLFAWEASYDRSQPCRGILASSPREFSNCSSLVPYNLVSSVEYGMSNNGLKISGGVAVIPAKKGHCNYYVLPLDCVAWESPYPVSIFLRHCGQNKFVRWSPYVRPPASEPIYPTLTGPVYITARSSPTMMEGVRRSRTEAIRISFGSDIRFDTQRNDVYPKSAWDIEGLMFLNEGSRTFWGRVTLEVKNASAGSGRFTIICGRVPNHFFCAIFRDQEPSWLADEEDTFTPDTLDRHCSTSHDILQRLNVHYFTQDQCAPSTVSLCDSKSNKTFQVTISGERCAITDDESSLPGYVVCISPVEERWTTAIDTA